MYHIFFIYSSIDGHLGCFHDLAIVNSAVMNIGVHVSKHLCLNLSTAMAIIIGYLVDGEK